MSGYTTLPISPEASSFAPPLPNEYDTSRPERWKQYTVGSMERCVGRMHFRDSPVRRALPVLDEALAAALIVDLLPLRTSLVPTHASGVSCGPTVARHLALFRMYAWTRELLGMSTPPEATRTPPSNYLTLIPLSDARLQPRDTRLTVVSLVRGELGTDEMWLAALEDVQQSPFPPFLCLLQLAFAMVIGALVFVAVPRGIYFGEVFIRPDQMSWNSTHYSYQLKLLARIPVYNPNYLKATIGGDLQIYFYKTEAGRQNFGPIRLPAKSSPEQIEVNIDASDAPPEYILAIASQCSTFPEVLIFFLRGQLTAKYLFQTQRLTAIDTYFLIDCKSGGPVPSSEGSALAALPGGMSSAALDVPGAWPGPAQARGSRVAL